MNICFLLPWRSFALYWPQVQPRWGWQEGSAGSRFPTCCSPFCGTSKASVIQAGRLFPCQLLTLPKALLTGQTSSTLSRPTEENPQPSIHGDHRCWGCAGRSGPSAPLRLPLALLPGLQRSTLLCTAHLRPRCAFPRWVPTWQHCCGCTGVKHRGWHWNSWMDGRMPI